MPQRTSKYPPKTLVNLQEVQVFAATFVDGQQFSDTRLVMKVGEGLHFLHPEGTDGKLRQPSGWLSKAIKERVGLSAPVQPELPKEDVELPTEAVS